MFPTISYDVRIISYIVNALSSAKGAAAAYDEAYARAQLALTVDILSKHTSRSLTGPQ